jgi:hypothetical protein
MGRALACMERRDIHTEFGEKPYKKETTRKIRTQMGGQYGNKLDLIDIR